VGAVLVAEPALSESVLAYFFGIRTGWTDGQARRLRLKRSPTRRSRQTAHKCRYVRLSAAAGKEVQGPLLGESC